MDKGVVLKNLLSIFRRFEPLWVAMFMLLMWLMYANYAVNTLDEVIFAIALIAVAAVKQLIQRQRHWDMPVSAIIFIGFIVYNYATVRLCYNSEISKSWKWKVWFRIHCLEFFMKFLNRFLQRGGIIFKLPNKLPS